MGQRYAVSGVGDSPITEASFDTEPLLGKEITTGRVLWLKNFWIYNDASELPINLQDATEGDTMAVADTRFVVMAASGRTTMVEFPAPGLKFSTGCSIILDGTASTTSAFTRGEYGGAGYEE